MFLVLVEHCAGAVQLPDLRRATSQLARVQTVETQYRLVPRRFLSLWPVGLLQVDSWIDDRLGPQSLRPLRAPVVRVADRRWMMRLQPGQRFRRQFFQPA